MGATAAGRHWDFEQQWLARAMTTATTKILLQGGGAGWMRGTTRVRRNKSRKPARPAAYQLAATLLHEQPTVMMTWQ
jgi:hypothetical protein